MLLQLINSQYLVSVLARQAIGRMYVELINTANVSCITKSFDRGPVQRRSANAIIEKTVRFAQSHSVLLDLATEIGNLRINRLLLGLCVG